MSLRKSAKVDNAHATFSNGAAGWVWKVLKVNQPKKTPFNPGVYATWFCAVKSPHTYGSWEYGDTYAHEVIANARLTDATAEFVAYTREF